MTRVYIEHTFRSSRKQGLFLDAMRRLQGVFQAFGRTRGSERLLHLAEGLVAGDDQQAVAGADLGRPGGDHKIVVAGDQDHQQVGRQAQVDDALAGERRAGADRQLAQRPVKAAAGVGLDRERRLHPQGGVDPQPARHPRQRRTLDQHRRQHDEEHQVEDPGRARDPGEHREGRQDDRSRPTQTHPGARDMPPFLGPLLMLESKWQITGQPAVKSEWLREPAVDTSGHCAA